MSKVSFQDISKVFAADMKGEFCIEIEFSLRGDEEFQFCWMGKMPDEHRKGQDVYWFGIKEDGSGAYEFSTFEAFSSAPVFHGKSLADVWDQIEIESIDGFDPEDRLPDYLRDSGRRMGAAY